MPPKYFCNQKKPHPQGQTPRMMRFNRVDVTQPAPGNPMVQIYAVWKCPACGYEMAVVLSWDAEKEVMT